MKINSTLFFSIILATGIVAGGVAFIRTSQERTRMSEVLVVRSIEISHEYEKSITQAEKGNDPKELERISYSLSRRYRLLGVALYGESDSVLYSTSSVKGFLKEAHEDVSRALLSDSSFSRFRRFGGVYFNQYIRPFGDGIPYKAIVVFAPAQNISDEIRAMWRRSAISWMIQAILVAAITMLIVRWSVFMPLNRLAKWMTSVRVGNLEQMKESFPFRFLSPLHKEATKLAEAMKEARSSAEEEARLRSFGEEIWTPERLKSEAGLILKDKLLIVVSNREPYIHEFDGKEIKCMTPASGMVTAMEPILMACGGLWIASGMGAADKKVVDEHDKIRVPPDTPAYTLRRIWITKEEEEFFYYGFSNEGLWPLCHIAHVRPAFRLEDWQHYQSVNRKFADSILEEIRNEEDPFILVQDYHFALLPAMIKESRPDARVSIFWHIPWPNPESFGICPWRNDLLMGMLGADLIGFHTQFHCNNFLSTVNRFLESRVTWENFSVSMGDHNTQVKPFPISIALTPSMISQNHEFSGNISTVLKEFGLQAQHIGVGVDRIDYTKGILERFLSIERFLEKNPGYLRAFTFVQIGAPSRTFIKNYSDLVESVQKEADRINSKFGRPGWQPILLLVRHHSHKEILPFYKTASFCMVTSLHDGMNLVAKEFVASRNNHTGVLILSRFAGAAQELSGSLIVNPYDIEEMADAILTALEMPVDEQKIRMDQMRENILRHNIYFWAGNFLRQMALK
jgi:trehalose-6-phosphate synthase